VKGALSRAPAVFLDRDGVLTELVQRDGVAASPRRVADFRIVTGAATAVRRLREYGLRVFVVTNQPDVARGHLSLSELHQMHRLLADSIRPDEIACCPHDDEPVCACRKPKPGMILDLSTRWAVDLARSFVVGDTWKDVEAGRAAGCRTILVGEPIQAQGVAADWVVPTLEGAVSVMERELGRSGEPSGLRS